MVEKGAAHVVEGTAKKYMPVPLEEFLENYMKKLEKEKSWLSCKYTIGKDRRGRVYYD